MSKITPILLLVICTLGTINASAAPNPYQRTEKQGIFQKDTLKIDTKSGNISIQVELAKTREEQELGLMYRNELPEGHGMLFVWDKDREVNMWMKNTLISLDMLFIDSAGKIIYIAQDTKPESTDVIGAGKPVRAVLELPAGSTRKYHIAVGHVVNHSHFKQ